MTSIAPLRKLFKPMLAQYRDLEIYIVELRP
jgi:hypothetical protein